ncbi:MAG: amidohydrolase family protein [Chloroflexota bacterium]|jgi:predicted TIM-barrel fold metal-dependent hydrolase|nr:amidohydrolase family protein [Chloroflexota bacterium]
MNATAGGAEFRFVDAHVHFYDMGHPRLRYEHWMPDRDHPFLGAQTRKLGSRNYLAEDFLADAVPHGMVKAIHVQAAIGSEDSVDETLWLQEASWRTGVPHAIVGYVDLRAADAEAEIERHLESGNLKGIRDFSHGDYLVNDEFQRGFGLLGRYGLISSVAAQWQDLKKLASLARAHPDITILLDHAGFPSERTPEYFDNWRSGIAIAAGVQNIICKISGLGMGDNNWTVESIRPYVETCIERFGPQRSLFATNWPIDSLWSSYGAVVDAYREITAGFSSDEIDALFAGNAERIYGI